MTKVGEKQSGSEQLLVQKSSATLEKGAAACIVSKLKGDIQKPRQGVMVQYFYNFDCNLIVDGMLYSHTICSIL